MKTPRYTNTAYLQWVALLTLIRHELMRALRLWQQTLLPPIITSTLYFIVFGRWLGQHIASAHSMPYINLYKLCSYKHYILLQIYRSTKSYCG